MLRGRKTGTNILKCCVLERKAIIGAWVLVFLGRSVWQTQICNGAYATLVSPVLEKRAENKQVGGAMEEQMVEKNDGKMGRSCSSPACCGTPKQCRILAETNKALGLSFELGEQFTRVVEKEEALTWLGSADAAQEYDRLIALRDDGVALARSSEQCRIEDKTGGSSRCDNNSLASLPRNNTVPYILVEGAICNGQFRPLRRPERKFVMRGAVTQLNCLNRFSEEHSFIYQHQGISQGLALIVPGKRDALPVLAYPLLWARVNSEAVMRWVTSPPQDSTDLELTKVATPLGPCSVRLESIKLQGINHSGYATVFYANEPDVRNCGCPFSFSSMLKTSVGHAAAAILPYPPLSRKDRQEALRQLPKTSKASTSFSSNPAFFAQAIKFNHIRVVLIDAEVFCHRNRSNVALTGKSTLCLWHQPEARKFLIALFEVGVMVAWVAGGSSLLAYPGAFLSSGPFGSSSAKSERPYRVTLPGRINLFVSPPVEAPRQVLCVYNEALTGLAQYYTVSTVIPGGQRLYAMISQLEATRKKYGLITALIGRQPKEEQAFLKAVLLTGTPEVASEASDVQGAQQGHRPMPGKTLSSAVRTLQTNWKVFAEYHPNVLPEAAKYALEEVEILVITPQGGGKFWNSFGCWDCTVFETTKEGRLHVAELISVET